jgi:hypothetical protein
MAGEFGISKEPIDMGSYDQTVVGTGATRSALIGTPTERSQQMIEDIYREATTRIGRPDKVQAGLMGDALSAQMQIAGMSPEGIRAKGELRRVLLKGKRFQIQHLIKDSPQRRV